MSFIFLQRRQHPLRVRFFGEPLHQFLTGAGRRVSRKDSVKRQFSPEREHCPNLFGITRSAAVVIIAAKSVSDRKRLIKAFYMTLQISRVDHGVFLVPADVITDVIKIGAVGLLLPFIIPY